MRLSRWTAAVAAVMTIAATGVISPLGAQARGSYEIDVVTRTPEVRYFKSFSYSSLSVTGPDRAMARTLTAKVRAFTLPWVDEYRDPDAKMTTYLKKAQPANLSVVATPTPGCHRNHVCLSQVMAFSTPLIAGSITDVMARAWSTKTAMPARLKDFVAPSALPAFTAKVKAAIRKDSCYYGFPIKLKPDYASYPHWVPLDTGIAVWFPEYQFGCQIMSLRVTWP